MARDTRLIGGAEGLESKDEPSMQKYADELPQEQRYSSDQMAVYGDLLWPDTPQGKGSSYVISYGKEQTYTIESMNADLRTYLGRLKRRSRCFLLRMRSWTPCPRRCPEVGPPSPRP